MRGGIEVYLKAGAFAVAEHGRVVVCADARTPERAFRGASEAGLTILRRRDVIPRAGVKGALFTVWTCARREDVGSVECEVAPPLVVRDEHGAIVDAIAAHDPAAARKRATQHILHGERRLEQGGVIRRGRRAPAGVRS